MDRHYPIVNTRGISDEPDQASRLLVQVVSGIQGSHVAATAKQQVQATLYSAPDLRRSH